MKLHAIIDRGGQGESAIVVFGETHRLFCTPRARERILVEMVKLGAICTRCSLVCRSDELTTDHVCADGVGCNGDIDSGLFRMPPDERSAAINVLLTTLWREFARRVPKSVADLDAPPTGMESGKW